MGKIVEPAVTTRYRAPVTKIAWLLAPALLLTLATACGGDDDDDTTKDDDTSSSSSSSEDAYVDEMMASMELSESGFEDDETNECVARAMIQGIGMENLEGKVTPEELADADQLADVGLTVDGNAVWAQANQCADMGLWLMTATAAGDETVTQCLMEATTDGERMALFAAGLEGEDSPEAAAATTAIGAALQVCSPTNATTAG